MNRQDAAIYAQIGNRLGQELIHHAGQEPVVLRPEWLSKAISFALDDPGVRRDHGLVNLPKLAEIWDNPTKPDSDRYEPTVHPLLLKLMNRCDLGYQVAGPRHVADHRVGGCNGTNPEAGRVVDSRKPEEIERTIVCRFVERESRKESVT